MWCCSIRCSDLIEIECIDDFKWSGIDDIVVEFPDIGSDDIFGAVNFAKFVCEFGADLTARADDEDFCRML